MYAIVGATGNTGSVAAERLLDAGAEVRVIGRSAERLRPFVDAGAESFVGSVDDPDAMVEAFDGATAAYAMIPPMFTAEDVRAYQRTVAEAITWGLASAQVGHVVGLSSIGAYEQEGTGPIGGLGEFEDRLNDLGAHVLHLRAAYFMENFLGLIPMIHEMEMIATPVKPDLPIPMIATRDIGAYAADRLQRLDFESSSTQELLGPRDIALSEATRILGTAIGKSELRYVQVPYEEAEAGLRQMGVSEDGAAMITEMNRAFNRGLVRAQEERSPENTTPTTLEEFARTTFAAAWE